MKMALINKSQMNELWANGFTLNIDQTVDPTNLKEAMAEMKVDVINRFGTL